MEQASCELGVEKVHIQCFIFTSTFTRQHFFQPRPYSPTSLKRLRQILTPFHPPTLPSSQSQSLITNHLN